MAEHTATRSCCGRRFDGPHSSLRADPTLAQDIEDGAALRRLREAADRRGRAIAVGSGVDGQWWAHDEDEEFGGDICHTGHGSTVAAAADKAREALESHQ